MTHILSCVGAHGRKKTGTFKITPGWVIKHEEYMGVLRADKQRQIAPSIHRLKGKHEIQMYICR